MGPVLLALVVLLAAARVGGSAAERFRQPAVLGELAAGILLGALPLAGLHGLEYAARDEVVGAIAELGVIFLLFEVGLSTRLADLLKVGPSALLVAVVGMAVPMALGYGAGQLLLPGRHPFVSLFLGATLCATSVGITARVLKDMGRVGSVEGQIILGAAVIDDVLGLLVLAVMVGLVEGQGAPLPTLGLVGGKAVAFLALALVVGRWAAPRLFRGASRMHGKGVLFTAALVACLGLSWLAEVAGLAPIVGAFAAGLVLEGVPWDELLPEGDRIEDLFLPLSTATVPLFFVRMGLQVDLRALAGGPVLLALALILAAFLGKQACGLAVLQRGVDRLAVGIGMVPRGEVGLIFAGIGMSLKLGGAPLLGPGELAAVVAMVLVTTMVTPPLLRWRLARPG
ncbi:cation:proton antiporter [Anaeromyxobacter paludicola]|uniref:Na+/H+-exchanging protein n=1 Tax=Anaeromyxobacter paludicola TaxID=2918171 RepID=A0ABN6NB04_9BACT|nr:cation:proton antiporter [Anaeromyxobacter paludicola]BDG10399.1 Na+/H+-exchanging protein [Anaeromyxobacter paludicola]